MMKIKNVFNGKAKINHTGERLMLDLCGNVGFMLVSGPDGVPAMVIALPEKDDLWIVAVEKLMLESIVKIATITLEKQEAYFKAKKP